jgi:hypothetical protein
VRALVGKKAMTVAVPTGAYNTVEDRRHQRRQAILLPDDDDSFIEEDLEAEFIGFIFDIAIGMFSMAFVPLHRAG